MTRRTTAFRYGTHSMFSYFFESCGVSCASRDDWYVSPDIVSGGSVFPHYVLFEAAVFGGLRLNTTLCLG